LGSILHAAASNGAGLALLDTAPHSQADSLVAAQAADLILIPCRPGILDLRAIGATVQIARLANRPAAVVLARFPRRDPPDFLVEDHPISCFGDHPE
jgi:chromosome partitioning protein